MTSDDGERPPQWRRRKDARPAEIIAAGLMEFSERGFAAARLDDVATRAGVAKGTIYRYFTDKEALFEAALRSKMAPVVGDVDALIEHFPGRTEDLLRMLVQRLYAEMFTTDLQILMRIIISEGSRFPKISKLYYEESVAKGRGFLGKIVARGIARGEFREGALADLPIVIMAPAIMAMVWRMTFDRFDPIETDRFLAAHLDLVFNGLRAP